MGLRSYRAVRRDGVKEIASGAVEVANRGEGRYQADELPHHHSEILCLGCSFKSLPPGGYLPDRLPELLINIRLRAPRGPGIPVVSMMLVVDGNSAVQRRLCVSEAALPTQAPRLLDVSPSCQLEVNILKPLHSPEVLVRLSPTHASIRKPRREVSRPPLMPGARLGRHHIRVLGECAHEQAAQAVPALMLQLPERGLQPSAALIGTDHHRYMQRLDGGADQEFLCTLRGMAIPGGIDSAHEGADSRQCPGSDAGLLITPGVVRQEPAQVLISVSTRQHLPLPSLEQRLPDRVVQGELTIGTLVDEWIGDQTREGLPELGLGRDPARELGQGRRIERAGQGSNHQQILQHWVTGLSERHKPFDENLLRRLRIGAESIECL